MKLRSFDAIASVAYKEFLHIYRDWRVLLLVLTLPPLFTLLFGYAFESGEITGVSSLLINRDNMPRTQEFIDIISKNKTFQWRRGSPDIKNESDLLGHGVQAALVIPAGWNESLENGDPKPLVLYIDGADINMVEAVEGSVRESLGDFQLKQRDRMIETLPEEVFDLGKQLPLQIRKRFVSMMEMWTVDHRLRCPRHYWADFATADGHAHGVHNRAGTRVRHALPADDNRAAAERNSDREDVAVSRSLQLTDCCYHAVVRLAFWSCIS